MTSALKSLQFTALAACGSDPVQLIEEHNHVRTTNAMDAELLNPEEPTT